MKTLKRERFILIIVLLLSLVMHLVYGLEGAAQVGALETKLDRQATQLRDKQREIEIKDVLIDGQYKMIEKLMEQAEQIKPKQTYAGEFEITYYTAGFESTGKYPGHPEYGITASGTTVKEGQTIAADWTVLPEGTKVYIEGVGERIVEDTGGLIKGNAIDVYVPDVVTALNGGRHMAKVYIVRED